MRFFRWLKEIIGLVFEIVVFDVLISILEALINLLAKDDD